MIEELAKDKIHFMISIWPSMDEKCQNYKEMLENNCLLPGVNICNSFDKKARELYWKQCRRFWMNGGADALWCDSDELAVSDPLPDVYQIVGHTRQYDGTPIITPHYACLDCRTAFVLDEEGLKPVS